VLYEIEAWKAKQKEKSYKNQYSSMGQTPIRLNDKNDGII